MRTKIEQNFLDKLEKYILTMGKTIDFTKQLPTTKEFFGKYLISSVLDKLSDTELLEVWSNNCSVLDAQLNSHEGIITVKEFIQKDLINRHSFFAFYVMTRPDELQEVNHD